MTKMSPWTGAWTTAALVMLLAGVVVDAGEAEQQLAFAEHLQREGDSAFAVLEYKRFLYSYPKHAQAPEALYQLGQVYLSYAQDLGTCRELLEKVIRQYPRSAAADRARALLDFVEVNSDFDGKPLVAWLQAQDAEIRGDHADAVRRYRTIITEHPGARLADDALYQIGLLSVEKLDQPAAAMRAFDELLRRYPKSELAPEADYQRAATMEKLKGPGKEALAAYAQLRQKYPGTPVADRAGARMTAIGKKMQVIKRQFAKTFVREHKVIKESYSDRRCQVLVQVPMGLSEREVKATLEDALVAYSDKRRKLKDSMQITAYYKYPTLVAGQVDWTPERAPAYRVKQIEGKDVVKDVLFDLLKKY